MSYRVIGGAFDLGGLSSSTACVLLNPRASDLIRAAVGDGWIHAERFGSGGGSPGPDYFAFFYDPATRKAPSPAVHLGGWIATLGSTIAGVHVLVDQGDGRWLPGEVVSTAAAVSAPARTLGRGELCFTLRGNSAPNPTLDGPIPSSTFVLVGQSSGDGAWWLGPDPKTPTLHAFDYTVGQQVDDGGGVIMVQQTLLPARAVLVAGEVAAVGKMLWKIADGQLTLVQQAGALPAAMVAAACDSTAGPTSIETFTLGPWIMLALP